LGIIYIYFSRKERWEGGGKGGKFFPPLLPPSSLNFLEIDPGFKKFGIALLIVELIRKKTTQVKNFFFSFLQKKINFHVTQLDWREGGEREREEVILYYLSLPSPLPSQEGRTCLIFYY
jgi:hypothetical protein